ncbi:MAG TPA: hypothetical protein VMX11_06865 [Actinomycetes bacterium]|nr:hypothetical protein [Actinomycetes bacterium]
MTRAFVLAVSVAVLLGACSVGSGGAAPSSPSPAPTQSTAGPDAANPDVESAEIVTVGDLACDPTSPVFDDPRFCRHEEVARLTSRLVHDGAEWFVPLGDIQYEDGTLDKFDTVYDKWFGKFRPITEPIAGIHEWNSEGAAGYSTTLETERAALASPGARSARSTGGGSTSSTPTASSSVVVDLTPPRASGSPMS